MDFEINLESTSEIEKNLAILEDKIKNYDLQIEQTCSENYGSFIECLEELLHVRPSAGELKRETVDINAELLKSTEIIQRKVEELIRARRILVNSSSSIELIKKCLFVLEQYSRFEDQLEEKKYLPALKTLELLERDHLPTISDYRFAQNICKEIPKFRTIIKDASKKDLNGFLEGLLMKSQDVGRIVLSNAAEYRYEQLDALESVDFCPVYRGLHIFTNLKSREEFNQYYKEQRQKQSRLAFNPPTNMSGSIEAYHDYFSSVVGFFVIEDHLMGTTKDFITSDYLNGLWQAAIQSITDSLNQHTKLCRDSTLIIEIERLFTLFTFTIRAYGHDTDMLATISRTIKERHNEILMDQPLNVQLQGNVGIDAEFQIYQKMNDQIDEFLSLADYDWTVVEAAGTASSFISDLIAWLKSTFQAFTNLPPRVAQGACMSACKHLAQSLRDMLLSEEVKALSLGGLEQFNLDLIQCELFAGSEPVKGFKEGDLQSVFAELRQICDLFLYEDYSTFMADMGKQQNRYLRVTTAVALNVVDKLRENDRKKFALKKSEKQKLRDTFAKSLRNLQEQQAASQAALRAAPSHPSKSK